MKKIYALLVTTLVATTTMQARQRPARITLNQLSIPHSSVHRAKAQAEVGPIITSQPAGTIYKDYAASGKAIYAGEYDKNVYQNFSIAKTYIKGDDGNLYIYEPLTFLRSESYLKLEPDGENAYVAKLPQRIYVDDEGNEYLIDKLYKSEDEWGDVTYSKQEGSNSDVVRFVWSGDTLKQVSEGMDGDYPISVMGMTYEGVFSTAADDAMAIFPVNEKPTTLPSEATQQQAILQYTTINQAGKTKLVKVAYTSTGDVYIENPRTAGQWIHATLQGQELRIAQQYLGLDTTSYVHLWATPVAYTVSDISGYLKYTQVENVSLSFDAEKQTITGISPMGITITEGHGIVGSVYDSYADIKLSPYRDEAKTPKAPGEVTVAEEYNDKDGLEVEATIPATAEDGSFIEVSKLYYCIYLNDDEVTSYTLTTTNYSGLGSDMTEIPYNFEDEMNQDIYSFGNEFTIWVKTQAERVGIQTIYKGGGEVRKSSITWSEKASVADAGVNRVALSHEYYDLQGRHQPAPQSGIYVVRTHYSDGTVSTAKMVK